MKSIRIATMLVFSNLAALSLAAQQPPVDHAAAVKQSLQKSAVSVRQYKWIETTTITMKGEDKSRTQNSCYYDATGKVQKVPVAAAPAAEEKRGVRGRVVENKKEEIGASVQAAVALVHQYIPPDPAKIQTAKEAGKLSIVPPDAQGNVRVTINGYLKAGDSLVIGLNAATNVITGINVSSFTDAKEPVGLNVAMSALPDGTVYAAKSTLDVIAQNLTVVVENTGYTK